MKKSIKSLLLTLALLFTTFNNPTQNSILIDSCPSRWQGSVEILKGDLMPKKFLYCKVPSLTDGEKWSDWKAGVSLNQFPSWAHHVNQVEIVAVSGDGINAWACSCQLERYSLSTYHWLG